MFNSDIRRIEAKEILKEKDLKKKASMMQYLAQQCRVDVFDVIHEKGTGHWGGSSSCAEILTSLYFHMMNLRPDEIKWDDRDRLVLSKGHASAMLYSILAQRGYFLIEELSTFRDIDSRLQGHPCMRTTPGVEMSTGALGHGLSVTLGMALAAKVTKRTYRSFVLVGEGCLDEGQTWEAVMAAAKYKPERLVLLIDRNRVQLDGPSSEVMPLEPLDAKLKAFNWNVAPNVYNGHSIEEILESWDWIQSYSSGPCAVIYRTVKGKGVSFMEDNFKWHGAPIDKNSYSKGRVELVKRLKELEAAL